MRMGFSSLDTQITHIQSFIGSPPLPIITGMEFSMSKQSTKALFLCGNSSFPNKSCKVKGSGSFRQNHLKEFTKENHLMEASL